MKPENRTIIIKLIGFLHLIRWPNILLYIFTLFTVAFFIMHQLHESTWQRIIILSTDFKLHRLILASSLSIAGAFIINAFYDYEKDLSNKGDEVVINKIISKSFSLNAYFVINFLVLILAVSTSFISLISFVIYLFILFMYSHKWSKKLVLNHLINGFVIIFPFMYLAFYLKFMNLGILLYGTTFFILLIVKDLVKELESIRGDLMYNYKSIAINFGIKYSKIAIVSLLFLTVGIMFYLVAINPISLHTAYLITIIFSVFFGVFFVIFAKQKSQYLFAHHIIKIIIVFSVLSLLFA